jgi:hypothetical protein
MNFFIPLDGDPSMAETLWRGTRELLRATGFPTRDERIQSLFVSCGPEPRVVQVSIDDEDSGEPVLMIFRAADAPFFWVCTMLQGLAEGPPIPVPASKVICATPFEP